MCFPTEGMGVGKRSTTRIHGNVDARMLCKLYSAISHRINHCYHSFFFNKHFQISQWGTHINRHIHTCAYACMINQTPFPSPLSLSLSLFRSLSLTRSLPFPPSFSLPLLTPIYTVKMLSSHALVVVKAEAAAA